MKMADEQKELVEGGGLIEVWDANFYEMKKIANVTLAHVDFRVGKTEELRRGDRLQIITVVMFIFAPWILLFIFCVLALLQATTSIHFLDVNYLTFFGGWIALSVFTTWLSFKMINSDVSSNSYARENKKVVLTMVNGNTVGKIFPNKEASSISKRIANNLGREVIDL